METPTKTSPAKTAAAPACATKNSPHSPISPPRLRSTYTPTGLPPNPDRTPGSPKESAPLPAASCGGSEAVGGRTLVPADRPWAMPLLIIE